MDKKNYKTFNYESMKNFVMNQSGEGGATEEYEN